MNQSKEKEFTYFSDAMPDQQTIIKANYKVPVSYFTGQGGIKFSNYNYNGGQAEIIVQKEKKNIDLFVLFPCNRSQGGSCCCPIPWTPASQQRISVTSPPPTFRFTFYLYVPPQLIIRFSRDPIFPKLITPSLFQNQITIFSRSTYTFSYEAFNLFPLTFVSLFLLKSVSIGVSTHYL